MFLDKIIVNIKLDGKELKSFPPRCGERQGQPLLFIDQKKPWLGQLEKEM